PTMRSARPSTSCDCAAIHFAQPAAPMPIPKTCRPMRRSAASRPARRRRREPLRKCFPDLKEVWSDGFCAHSAGAAGLRRRGGARQVEASGATLSALLDDLFARYPAVREQVLTAEGGLSRFINVFVNDQDVRYLQGLETPLAAGDTVTLLPAMAGGGHMASRL